MELQSTSIASSPISTPHVLVTVTPQSKATCAGKSQSLYLSLYLLEKLGSCCQESLAVAVKNFV